MGVWYKNLIYTSFSIGVFRSRCGFLWCLTDEDISRKVLDFDKKKVYGLILEDLVCSNFADLDLAGPQQVKGLCWKKMSYFKAYRYEFRKGCWYGFAILHGSGRTYPTVFLITCFEISTYNYFCPKHSMKLNENYPFEKYCNLSKYNVLTLCFFPTINHCLILFITLSVLRLHTSYYTK